jgi:hypothetical protein
MTTALGSLVPWLVGVIVGLVGDSALLDAGEKLGTDYARLHGDSLPIAGATGALTRRKMSAIHNLTKSN